MVDALRAGGGMLLPAQCLRKNPLRWPAMSEAETARHFIALSRLDARADAHGVAAAPPLQFLTHHPAAPDETAQGFLACLHELQEMLCAATGVAAVSLAAQSDLQSKFACMAMMRAYHDARGDIARSVFLVPAPASNVFAEAAALCGYTLLEIPLDAHGVMDRVALKAAAGRTTAALLMAHNCASGIKAVVRDAGGLLHGCVSAGDAAVAGDGVDALGISLPQDGAAKAWAVGVAQPLAHFLPLPVVGLTKDVYRTLGEKDLPLSIGRLGASVGDAGVLLRAYAYMRMRGATCDATMKNP